MIRLPVNPDLAQLKKQAKDILKDHHIGTGRFCGTLRHVRRFRNQTDRQIISSSVSLQEVHHALAIEYGFSSWKDLREHLLAQNQAWEQGLTMNVIGPGPVPSIATLEEAADHCAHGPVWRERTRVSPQDIAEAAAFLCSEAGRFITGCIVPFRER